MTPADDPLTMVPSSGGVRVAVHDLGGPDEPEAPVLLLSHATGFHGLVFQPLASHLTSTYRCLALDYRGHGSTLTPEGTPFAWSGMGDDAVAVLESELIGPGREVHGVGHSMGGAALVLAEARRPGTLRSLWLYEPVIVKPGLLPQTDDANPMAEAAARRRNSFESYDAARANFSAKPPLDQLHPDALRSYVLGGFTAQTDGTVTLRCRPATEAAVYAGAATGGAWDVWSSLTLPVAVVAGRAEDFGPVTFTPSLVEALPQAVLIERRDLRHFGPLENPRSMAIDVDRWIRGIQHA